MAVKMVRDDGPEATLAVGSPFTIFPKPSDEIEYLRSVIAKQSEELIDLKCKLEGVYACARGEQRVLIEGVGELVCGTWLDEAEDELAILRERTRTSK